MIYFILVVVALLAVSFVMASASQSYAVAQQAQAAIEASRATQIVGANNLILTVWERGSADIDYYHRCRLAKHAAFSGALRLRGQ